MRIISSTAIAAAAFVAMSSLALAQTSPGGSNTMPPASSGAAGSSSMSGSTGMSSSAGSIKTETQVKQKLAANGYTNVEDVHQAGDGWAAKATKNGKLIAVIIDSNGKIGTE